MNVNIIIAASILRQDTEQQTACDAVSAMSSS